MAVPPRPNAPDPGPFANPANRGDLIIATGILGDLVLPADGFDPGRADEIRELAAQAAVYATQARGPGTLRAYRSAWRQYDAWCVRLGLPALSADPRLVGM